MKATLEAIERGTEIERIPARQVANNMEEILFDHFSLNNSKSLSPLEKGEGMIRIMSYKGYNKSEVAERLGIDKSNANKYMKFATEASSALKKAVTSGNISYSAAFQVINDSDGIDEQNKTLYKVLEAVGGEDEGKKKGKRATVSNVKKTTGSKRVTNFDRLIELKDSLEGTTMGDKLSVIIDLIEKKESTARIKEVLAMETA